MNPPSFVLSEEGAFNDSFEWRLKEQEIRFRGSGAYANLVHRRIPASDEQIRAFTEALRLLEVWEWRNDYSPEDAGWMVDDGSAWKFEAEINGRICRCGGANAYPAYSSPLTTSMNRERFSMLEAALYDAFSIEGYIHQAKLFAEREATNASADEKGTSKRQ